MYMAVMAGGCAAAHFFHGHDTAFEFFAADMFELDGRVADVEVIVQDLVELGENAGAFRGRNVGDGDVAGERAGAGAETPYVQIVDVDHAFDGFHAGADGGERDAAGCSFEEDIQGFTHDADAGPENESGDEERQGRIDPVLAAEENAGASGDDGSGGEGVSGHVNKGAAEIDVAGHSPQKGGDDAVHENASCGNDHHETGVHVDRRAEAMDCLNGDPDGDDDQRCCIDERSEDAGALIAEGLGIVGGTRLKVDGGKTEEESQEIRDVVARFGQESKRVGAQPRDKRDNNIREGGYQREAKDGLSPLRARAGRRRMDMHASSLNGVQQGLPVRSGVGSVWESGSA